MSAFFNSIFTLLTTPPGNLIYHLVLAFSVAGALLVAFNNWRISRFPPVKRALLGLGILLGLQIFLFAVSRLVWQGLVNSQVILPPVDRVVSLLSLIWIAWLWAFPDPVRTADAVTWLLNLLIVVFFGLTLGVWTQSSQFLGLDRPTLETIWQVLSLAIILVGILTLVMRQPNGWGNGLAMLILAFAGHLANIIYPSNGDFPGVVRLTQICMYPILLTLPQHFPTPTIDRRVPAAISTMTDKIDQQSAERRRFSANPKTFHALLDLAAELDIEKIGNALTRSIAQVMLADLCFLITPTDDKNLAITCGYDLIREENLNRTSISSDAVPLLATAIQRGRPLRLPASSTSSNLKVLGQILGLTNPGHLLSVPILSSEHRSLGAILLLSPYSNRMWSAEDLAFLTNASTLFVPIFERGERMTVLEQERDYARKVAQLAEEQAATEKKKFDEISSQFDNIRNQVPQTELQAKNMAALVAMQEESQKIIEHLKAENAKLRNSPVSGGNDYSLLEQELRRTLEEMTRMQNALAESKIKIQELEKLPTSPSTSDQAEVIASISKELRQPMSSIAPYTDLLLLMAESVGILCVLQRKFLERVKSSTDEKIGESAEISGQDGSAHAQDSQVQFQAENMAALVAMQEESKKLIEHLKAENEKLRNSPGAGSVETAELEKEMRQTLEEMTILQDTLADSKFKIQELEKRSSSPINGDQVKTIASISQELRQPMSSISGYTDVLLAESVGILGALQRKFLERIKSATDRIGGLVDDLIKITILETDRVEIKPESVDLNLIIDNAVSYTSILIREKNITLRLDTPEIPPKIMTDREALQQILIHLLQNAGAATPVEGTVTLHVQLQEQDGNDYLQIQVSDTGNGISIEDLPRVFQRQSRADHVPIQGLGNSGIGLSIAKSLVDAQNGRIWVNTQAGFGSTFSVILPVTLTDLSEKS